MRFSYLVLATIATLGCKQGGEPPAEPTTCPPPSTTASAAGDANGDEAVDIADAIWVFRHAAEGGPAPSCDFASDLIADGRIEVDDATSLLIHLYEGAWPLHEVRRADCRRAEVRSDGPCASPVVRLVASGNTVEVVLEPGGAAVEAWSLALLAEGDCTLAGTTDGTAGALRRHGGHRGLGYDATFSEAGKVTSAVVLDLMDATALPVDRPSTLLRVEATGSCRVTLPADGARLRGERVRSRLVVGGGYALQVPEASVAVGG